MMNHDGSQQYTFGYGLANASQIQLQQQPQQIQLQQHHFQQQHPQQILQPQGNSTIPTQNLFQLQVGGTPATALLQQNDNTASMAQHGLISQPVIHASISVSLDNSKSIQGLNSMEAMVYPQQNNGLKIITNSGNFMQQPEIHFQSLDGIAGKSNVFDGMASATQSNVGGAFGKQTFSGWVQRGGVGNQQYGVGQNALPSFGHLWSHFQQQKTQVNIVQQQQIGQFPSQTHQLQSHPHPLGQATQQQAPQQFTVSGIQPLSNIQMIKVQQPNSLPDQQTVLQTAKLIQPCRAAAPMYSSTQLTSSSTTTTFATSSLPSLQQPTALNQVQTCLSLSTSQNSLTSITSKGSSVQRFVRQSVHGNSLHDNITGISKKSSKMSQRKFKPTQPVISSPSGISVSKVNSSKLESPYSSRLNDSPLPSAVRVNPSSGKALSESGPPKVTVTLDTLANNLSHLSEKPDSSFQMVKVADKVSKLPPRNHAKTDKSPSLMWQQTHIGPHEKKTLASNHPTSSTGSSLDRPSSEDSNFSSPPYSFTPPISIDSVFSPPPFTKLMPETHLASFSNTTCDPLTPSLSSSSSFKSTSSSSPSSILSETISNKNNVTSLDKPQHTNDMTVSTQTPTFTNSIMSASCCSIAITTTSVTSSSPRSNGDIAAAASVHSFTPLSSPIVSGPKTHWLVDVNTSNGPQKLIKVPYSWQRILEDEVVIYLSPSGAVLTSLDEIRDYLLSQDTCKCGLECPFQVEEVFVFDSNINNLPWSDPTTTDNGMGNLCNHRREVLAMAAFHHSQTQARRALAGSDSMPNRKRERRKSLTSGDDLVVTPLKKLRTSITHAVNKHAMLHSNNNYNKNTVSGNSLSSPLSEMDTWQKDDDVFYPMSTTPLSSNSALGSPVNKPDSSFNILDPYQTSGNLEFGGSSKEDRPKFFSDNLVYSNHHPSQRLGVRGIPFQSTPQSRSISQPLSLSLPNTSGWQQNQQLEMSPSIAATTSSKNTSQKPPSSFELKQMKKHKSDIQLYSPIKPKLSDCKISQKSTLSESKEIVNATSHQQVSSTKFKTSIGTKAKREKLKTQGSLASPCEKPLTKNSSLSSPSTSVSFLENPTVFVAQQTAIINNSLSSCNIDCSSPGLLEKSNALTTKTLDQLTSVMSEEEDFEETLFTSREEEDDHKANFDRDSIKSFSDTTENNDSAYLSQTGSDQEKSDTVDGLDCLSKSSDVYDFSSSEDQLDGLMAGNAKTSLVDIKLNKTTLSDPKMTTPACNKVKHVHDLIEKSDKFTDHEIVKDKLPGGDTTKIAGSKSVKSKQNRLCKKKTPSQGSSLNCSRDNAGLSSPQEKSFPLCHEPGVEKSVLNSFSSLNSDLSQLLASNNWNIPALQKVLVQHSAGDPERLRLAIQQVMNQITTSNETSLYNTKNSTICSNNNNSNNNNNNNTQIVASNSNLPKESKQDANKQQALNINACKNVSTIRMKSSSVSAGKDDSSLQKTTRKTNQVLSPNTLSGSMDSKLVTVTNKVLTKQDGVGKSSNCTRLLSSTLSNSTVVPSSGTSVCSVGNPASVVAPSPQGSPQASIILTTAKPHVPMSVSTMPSVSINMATVSKPQQQAQVIPKMDVNQGILQTQSFLGPNNHGSATTQLLNQTPSQTTQIVNTLSIPGLNNSLVLTNPIQQPSPSSVAQLSPALAAGQMIAPGQQLSPSFVSQNQLPKPGTASMTNHPNLAISNSTPIPLASNPTMDVTGSIHQGTLTGSNKEILNVITGTRTPTLTQNTAVANASIYSAASQPVFVIPQAKPVPPVVQLVGSSQTLATASGLQTDMTQLLTQATISDQTQQIQNLIAATGFNPLGLQPAWNTVNLNAQQQQQQQQQLQLLQLQQLMLPMIQNQTGAASACPNQSNTLMNAVVAQQGLQINQMVDVKAIQQNLSPAGQGFNNPTLSPVAQAAFPNHIQQMASPLTVQVGPAATNPGMASTINPPVSLSTPVNILQHTGPVTPLKKAAVSVPTESIAAIHIAPRSSPSIPSGNNKSVNTTSNSAPCQPDQLVSKKSPASTMSTPPIKPAVTGKSSSKSNKSKSKKSDSNKVKDPQVAKDEEHIANAVNQILAQAVQQQRELTLAAQNQPPPPPKSRNRKRDSQARARAAAAAHQVKEQELGKIASISDDTVFHHQLQPPAKTITPTPPSHLPFSSSLSSSSPSSSSSLSLPVTPESHLVNVSSFAAISSSSQSGTRPTVLPSHTTLNSALPCLSSSSMSSSVQHQDLHHPSINTRDNLNLVHQNPNNLFCTNVNKTSHGVTSGGENISNDTSKTLSQLPSVKCGDTNTFRNSPLAQALPIKNPSSLPTNQKKSGISLKEHLSSIVVSKDKELGKKKGSALASSRDSNPKSLSGNSITASSQDANGTPSPLVNGAVSAGSRHPVTTTNIL